MCVMAECAISVLSGWTFQLSKKTCVEEQRDYRPEKETQSCRHVVGGMIREEDVKYCCYASKTHL